MSELSYRKVTHYVTFTAYKYARLFTAVKTALYLYLATDKRGACKVALGGNGIILAKADAYIAHRSKSAAEHSVFYSYIALG